MQTEKNLIIYGANGYTGTLIVEEAIRRGIKPILAGRNAAALQELGRKYQLEVRVFSLDIVSEIERQLESCAVVIHAAGPFIHTAKPMIKACLTKRVHYLDITGEVPVFELAATYDQVAKEKGIMIMPGTGFDVVPTDCAAVHASNKLPDATHLQLAFATKGGRVSRGTALTAIENLGTSGLIRRNGVLSPVPFGYKAMNIDFGRGKLRYCTTIPWGDLATAWRSTGIPNIETYMAMPSGSVRLLTFMMRWFGGILKKQAVKNFLRKKIKSGEPGPDAQMRQTAKAYVYGMARNPSGEHVSVRYLLPETYHFTALSAVHIAHKVMQGQFKIGYQTPASCYGSTLLLEIQGCLQI
jgi:short subunit dehydrogenase-like uncharacterized protein